MTEVKWIGEGDMARKSMEPLIKDSVVYYRHQIEGVRQLAVQPPNFILADEMGLGKSLQALTVFAVDVWRGYCRSAIVVCPTTLKNNWSDEIEKFTGFQHIVLQGTPAKRKKLLEEFRALEGFKILVVNYEQVPAHLTTLNTLRFDCAIFDEAHYIKNYKAKRTKACHDLFSRRSFMLTGTPLLNRVNELWSLLHRCNPVQFKSYYNFTHRFCVYGGFGGKEIVGTKNEAELRSYLDKYMLRRLKKDVLDLPEVQVIERKVSLLPEQQTIYDEVKDELKLTVAGSEDAQDIENALTKFLRLKQVCGTTLPFTGEDKSGKLDLAAEDAQEILSNNNRLVVFTQFRDVQRAYEARIQSMGYPTWTINGDTPQGRRPEIVKEWGSHQNAGALICMIQVAGVGLNMTQSRYLQLLDKLFVPGLNQQAIDRLHRIGANLTQPIQVFDYLTKGTVETRVNAILRIKSVIEKDIIGKRGESDQLRKRLLAAMQEELE